MPRPIEYEYFIRDILASELSREIPESSVKLIHDKKLVGHSGHAHQVDVYAELQIAAVQFILLIECKCYSRKVSIEDVLEFSSRLKDCGAHKGILVSTIGFQKGATKIAKSNGIALVRVGSIAVSQGDHTWKPLLAWRQTSVALEQFVRWCTGSDNPPQFETQILNQLNCENKILTDNLTDERFSYPEEKAIVYHFDGAWGTFTVDRNGLLTVMVLGQEKQFFHI